MSHLLRPLPRTILSPTNSHRLIQTTTAKMTTPTRTYDDALRLLSLLQPNFAITSLFSSPPPPPTTTTTSSALPPPKKKDLNSLAIPEMLTWLSRASLPPSYLSTTPLRCVHVAGTKGKGSVTALIASILSQYPEAGRVATYTSPHVLSVRERITLDGAPVSRDVFTRAFYEVWDRLSEAGKKEGVEDWEGAGTKPFYFRFLTILAFHLFVKEGVRSAVVECGIGGEYDATNVLPEGIVTASVVTRLGVDHTAMLGKTVEEIAWHKAGVWKRGVKGFTRREEREGVRRVLRERAEEKGGKLVEVEVAKGGGDVVEGARLQGPWQRENMVLAVAAAREHLVRLGLRFEGAFGDEGWRVEDIPEEFRRGLREATLRGRCERLADAEGVEWFVDGAHTEDSLAGVGQWFAGKVGNGDEVRVLVFNQQERDPAVLLKSLLSRGKESSQGLGFKHAIFCRNEDQPAGKDGPARDLAVQKKARDAFTALDENATTSIHDSAQAAIAEIRSLAAEGKKNGKACKVLVTGSFHLIGPVLKTIDHVEY